VHIAGHQYKVSPGDLLSCQRIDGDIGDTIKLDKVLMVGDATFTKLGMPLVAGSYVSAVIEEQTLADKIIVFKKRRRKGYERTRGHRQRVTTIRIVDVVHE
jgi:large subunit ribosomal protein L21